MFLKDITLLFYWYGQEGSILGDTDQEDGRLFGLLERFCRVWYVVWYVFVFLQASRETVLEIHFVCKHVSKENLHPCIQYKLRHFSCCSSLPLCLPQVGFALCFKQSLLIVILFVVPPYISGVISRDVKNEQVF